MADVMKEIVDALRPALMEEKCRLPIFRLSMLCGTVADQPRDFAGALKRKDGIAVIAEIKKASPSKGMIRPRLNAAELAASLAGAGAAALSVVTEPNFFCGSRENLLAARFAAPDTPILRKDFIFDPYQLYQAKMCGADAVLLIAALLPREEFAFLHNLARDLGLAVLAEVRDEAEMEMALAAGASIVGVNARNLRDFSTDIDAAAKLISKLPANVIKVAESAIRTAEDLKLARSAGADAALIGEALMRAGDPAAQLSEIYGN